MFYHVRDGQHNQISKSIKLLVKIKNVSFILWKKKLNEFFGQPDTIISISLSPGMILSSSSQTPEPFLGPQFTLIMVSRSVITPLSTSLSTFFLDLHLFILSLDHLIDILTSWNHSLLFRRPSWGGGAPPAEPRPPPSAMDENKSTKT